jgi:hypothetical protein
MLSACSAFSGLSGSSALSASSVYSAFSATVSCAVSFAYALSVPAGMMQPASNAAVTAAAINFLLIPTPLFQCNVF